MNINPHAFTQLINQIRRGQSAEELSEALADAQAAAKETGKVATITYTVKIKPESRGMDGMFMVTDDIKTKIPKFDRGSSVMFESADLQLQLEDPRQQKMDLRSVSEDTHAEVRTVAEKAPATLKKVN